MPRRVTVVLRAVDGRHDDWLAPVVRALDAQTLPVAEFEVLVVAAAGSSAHARLTELAARRPNVQVLDAAGAAAAAHGTWLLDLGADVAACRPVLAPTALAVLADAGDRAGADVVLGRTVAAVAGAGAGPVPALDALVPGATVPDEVLATLAAASDGGPVLRPVVLTRTQRSAAPADGAPAPAPPVVVTVTDEVCAALAVPAAAASAAPASTVTATWEAGVLRLRAEGLVLPKTPDAGGSRVVLGVRRADTGAEYFLPTTTTQEGDGVVAAADLDVRTAAAGGPLPRAVWDVTVGVHGPGAGVSARGPVLSAGTPGTALVDGVPVVPGTGATLTVGVGGAGGSVVGRARPQDATVTESARGTLLRLDLPHVHAAGAARVRGALRMGTFPVPADLVVEAGAARLECWLTGLAGTSELSVVFGGPAARTGLTLDVSEVGVMTVRATPPKKAAAPKRPAAAPKPTPSRAVAARVRRAVPQTLEPAVRRLRGNRLARSAYSALIRRG